MDVYDSYGTLLLTVKEADIDWNASGVDSAIGHGHMCVPSSAAPGPLRIAIRPHTQGYTTPEDYSVSVASGPWVDTGDTGAVPFLHNEVGLMYQLTDRRDDGLGTSFYFDSPVTPTQAPSPSPTNSSGSGTDPVFNDCNEDSDCSSDEVRGFYSTRSEATTRPAKLSEADKLKCRCCSDIATPRSFLAALRDQRPRDFHHAFFSPQA